MRSNHLLATAAVASLLALAGCDKARPLPAPADPSRGCTSCHGGQDNLTGAPPFSLPRNAAGDIVSGGNTFDNTASTTQIEVGAHTRHIARGVSCGACHVVPATIQAPNHNTGKRATVTFKELAAAGNAIPSAWVPAVHTCANYCHGSSLNHGGTNHSPDWLGGAPGGACGTCHFTAGVTPPASHPRGTGTGGAFADTAACARCHPDTINADGTINVAGGKHVNGQLDGGGGHSAGWYDPTNPPGAHGAGANGGLQNCTSCHGTDFNGGTSGVSCNACHATNGHPNWQTECTFCHGSPTRTADATFPNVGTGTVVRANLAAPPVGSQGETNTTAYAVGAHEAHVAAGPFARAAQCSECHGATLPSDLTHVGGTVWIGWGVTAGNGVTPAPAAGNLVRWSDTGGVVPNCTNFCHGASLAGGTHTSVKWNEGAAGAACGSCHSIPLPYTAAGGWHVQRNDCAACHPGYTSTSVNVADHIFVGAGPQGLTCTSCHGSATNSAPPSDTAGNSTGVKVGAHQKHLATTLTPAALGCSECHTSVSSTLHANGTVGIAWALGASTWPPAVFPAPAPSAGQLPASWEAAPNCTNYCHGGFTNGKGATVSWTSTTAMTCNSCHGAPGSSANPATLPGGTHPQSNPDCSACHTGYTTTTVNKPAHLNGQLDVVAMACNACHGDLSGTRIVVASAPSVALVRAAPPQDASGGTSGILVGAHQQHVNQGATTPALSNALSCENCHSGQVPTVGPHAAPPNPVAFGNLATAASAAPVPYAPANKNCSNTYCHGQFAGGKAGNTVNWGTGTTAKLACNACHGQSVAAPQPTYPHPQNTTCVTCHGGYSATAVAAATHVDGLITKSTSGCTACHGELNAAGVTLTAGLVKSAPGASLSANSYDTTGLTAGGVAIGAHEAHLVGAGGTLRWRSAPIACTECHLLPPSNTDTSHATGIGTGGARATVAFGNLATDTAFETKTASYVQATGCAATYCHDPKSADTATGQVNAPLWTGATTQAQCGSCHGLPPLTAAHPQPPTVTDCGSCHPGYIAGAMPTSASTITAVNPATHINGALDGGGESGGGATCTGCHTGIVNMMTTAASKHSLVGWTDTFTDAGGAWGAATVLSSILPANRSCVNMCHSDHPHTLTAPATATHQYNLVLDPSSTTTRNAATDTSATRAATDFDPAANTGMCTKCHGKPIVANGITVTDASFGASAHDFTTSTTPAIAWSFALHDGSLFLRNCTKCHASATEGTTPAVTGATGLTAVHGQANPNLLAGTSRPNGVAAGFVCYNCHGSTATPANGVQGNRSNKNIQAQIAKTRNHPANADNVHDTATELANAIFGNTLGVTGRHSSCMDCHDTHEARAGTHAQGTNVAGPPLQGAWGVKFGGTLAAFAAPTAANFTKVPSMVAGTDLEATLCFKCHSAYYGTLPTSPSGAFTETDQAREFNPANPSFHPVLASNSGTIGNTGNITAPWTKTSLMTCTDCHESNLTTDPSGPHGSTAGFILKGPNTTWSSAVTNSSSGMPAGTFCANCHAANFAGSRFPGHTNGRHNIACTGCHVLIPHGSGHVGMLVSLAGGAGGTAVTDSAPYAVGVRLGIGSYPSATANWGNGNCGCDSVATGH